MIIIGGDFQTRFRQIAMLDPVTGEIIERRLEHENGEAEKSNVTLPALVRVGMVAAINAPWLERTLSGHYHKLWMGDAVEIRAVSVRK
jgi:hypothetical protein